MRFSGSALAGVVGDVDRVVGLEQEGEHLGGFAQQRDALLDQRRGLGEDLLLAGGQGLADESGGAQVRDQAAAEVLGRRASGCACR